MTRFAIFATLLAVQFASGVSEYGEVRQLRIRREPSVGGEGSLRDHETNARTYSYRSLSDAASAGKRVEVEPTSVGIVEGYPMRVKFKDSPTNWTSCKITAPDNIRLKRGANRILKPDTGNVTFCQLEDPEGVQTPLIIGTCQYNIPVVTARHDGNWTVVYGTEEKIIPMNASFTVTTYYDWTIESSINLTEDNKTQLLCRVNVSEPQALEFCHFTRPDGHVLSLPGIGSKRYSTSIISKPKNQTNLDCDLIINSPLENEDYGAWRCRITDQKNNTYGTVLHLNSDIGSNKTRIIPVFPNIVARKIYVKRNDSYQIKCTANAALSYCWFRSPNGTAYSVSQSKVRTPFSLLYVGSGLLLGDCAAEIDHASFSDHGEWTCNVGVVNGSEERQPFTVHVAESYVIPGRAKLIATETDNIILSCKILPNVTDRAVHYCRWIRPDGYGIYNGVSHRYMTNTSNTRCRLIIPYGGNFFPSYRNTNDHLIYANTLEQNRFCGGIKYEVTSPVSSLNWLGNSNFHVAEHPIDRSWSGDVLYQMNSEIRVHTAKRILYDCPVNLFSSSDTGCLRTDGRYSVEDLGNWTCVAGLMGANSTIEESQATVIVSPLSMRYQTLIGITVVLSMILMIIVSALSLVQLRKRLRALPADPPPYTVEAAPIPRFMKAESDSKEFRY